MGTKAHWVDPCTIFGGLLLFINYKCEKEKICVITSKNKESKLVVSSNEDVVAALLLSLYYSNIEDSDKQDIVSKVEFEAIIPSIKNYFFHPRIINFVNKLELSDQKYQNIGNVKYEHYKERILFYINGFLSFGTDCY